MYFRDVYTPILEVLDIKKNELKVFSKKSMAPSKTLTWALA